MRPVAHPRRIAAVAVLFASLIRGPALAQTPLTLQQAIAQALDRYPAVRAAAEQASAADAALALARTAYLPRADLLWQANHGTRNNITSILLPQSVISNITGPVLPESAASAWNSVAGALVAWEPIDFGSRAATVRAADASRTAATAAVALTRLQVGAATADAFLAVIAADEAVRSARAGVERARVLFDVVDARARAGLRPGADAARARAEVAVAESAQARAEQSAAVARAELARWVGTTPEQIDIVSAAYLQPPPAGPPGPALESHPLVQAQAARLTSAEATAEASARAYAPRLFVEGTTYARGSGFQPDGTAGGLNGFDLTARNWAAGVNVTFPLFDLAADRARHAGDVARQREAAARYEQARQDLTGDRLKAQAALDAARRVASLTPTALDAARTAEQQARARYDAGLGTLAEVAETERLLTDADAGNAVAILEVWRAQLAAAAAAGDLTAVLNAVGGR